MPSPQNISNLIPRRQYMQMLRNLRDQNIIKVITGVRRCGKSTLLQMYADELLQQGVEQAQIQFLNFEDLDTLAIGDIFQIHTQIKDRLLSDKMNYIFLDEIQNIKDFQRLVDSLYIKKNCDVYITGSNAYLLSGELATLLTGRYIEINILPLYFSEFQEFMAFSSQNLRKTESFRNNDIQDAEYQQDMQSKPPNLSKIETLAVIDIQDAEYQQDIQSKSPNLSKLETLAGFCTEGGIPEYYKQKNISQKQADDFVKSVLNTIIEKDIFARLSVKDKHNFNKIIDFVFDSVGSFVSPRSISDTLKTQGMRIDKEAVARYLDALCDVYLLYKVQRYEIKGKGLLQTLNKYYLVDPCFRKV